MSFEELWKDAGETLRKTIERERGWDAATFDATCENDFNFQHDLKERINRVFLPPANPPPSSP